MLRKPFKAKLGITLFSNPPKSPKLIVSLDWMRDIEETSSQSKNADFQSFARNSIEKVASKEAYLIRLGIYANSQQRRLLEPTISDAQGDWKYGYFLLELVSVTFALYKVSIKIPRPSPDNMHQILRPYVPSQSEN